MLSSMIGSESTKIVPKQPAPPNSEPSRLSPTFPEKSIDVMMTANATGGGIQDTKLKRQDAPLMNKKSSRSKLLGTVTTTTTATTTAAAAAPGHVSPTINKGSILTTEVSDTSAWTIPVFEPEKTEAETHSSADFVDWATPADFDDVEPTPFEPEWSDFVTKHDIEADLDKKKDNVGTESKNVEAYGKTMKIKEPSADTVASAVRSRRRASLANLGDVPVVSGAAPSKRSVSPPPRQRERVNKSNLIYHPDRNTNNPTIVVDPCRGVSKSNSMKAPRITDQDSASRVDPARGISKSKSAIGGSMRRSSSGKRGMADESLRRDAGSSRCEGGTVDDSTRRNNLRKARRRASTAGLVPEWKHFEESARFDTMKDESEERPCFSSRRQMRDGSKNRQNSARKMMKNNTYAGSSSSRRMQDSSDTSATSWSRTRATMQDNCEPTISTRRRQSMATTGRTVMDGSSNSGAFSSRRRTSTTASGSTNDGRVRSRGDRPSIKLPRRAKSSDFSAFEGTGTGATSRQQPKACRMPRKTRSSDHVVSAEETKGRKTPMMPSKTPKTVKPSVRKPTVTMVKSLGSPSLDALDLEQSNHAPSRGGARRSSIAAGKVSSKTPRADRAMLSNMSEVFSDTLRRPTLTALDLSPSKPRGSVEDLESSMPSLAAMDFGPSPGNNARKKVQSPPSLLTMLMDNPNTHNAGEKASSKSVFGDVSMAEKSHVSHKSSYSRGGSSHSGSKGSRSTRRSSEQNRRSRSTSVGPRARSQSRSAISRRISIRSSSSRPSGRRKESVADPIATAPKTPRRSKMNLDTMLGESSGNGRCGSPASRATRSVMLDSPVSSRNKAQVLVSKEMDDDQGLSRLSAMARKSVPSVGTPQQPAGPVGKHRPPARSKSMAAPAPIISATTESGTKVKNKKMPVRSQSLITPQPPVLENIDDSFHMKNFFGDFANESFSASFSENPGFVVTPPTDASKALLGIDPGSDEEDDDLWADQAM